MLNKQHFKNKSKEISIPMVDNRKEWQEDMKDYNLLKDYYYIFRKKSLANIIIQERFLQCYERIK